MRHTEFWTRMERSLGSEAFARHWAQTQVLSGLAGRTPAEALAEGVPPKQVWAEVWRARELPDRDR